MRIHLPRASLRACALSLSFVLGPILAHAVLAGRCAEGQLLGTRAKEYTSELAFGREVTVYGDKRDRYGCRLAEVLLPDGRSLNQELIKAGLALWPRKYSKAIHPYTR